MKPIQILLPMGGLGQRFRNEGFRLPKPLINVNGKPMFLRALSSFEAYEGSKKTIFVVRQDAEDEHKLATKIRQLSTQSPVSISILHQDTRGATETALLAREHINPELPLIIMDCDFYFTSSEYFKRVKDMITNNASDGVLLSFDSRNDRYSYAKLDNKGYVTETAEKKVISNNALAGAYCFSSGKVFLDAADELLSHPINDKTGEYYISYLYNILISQGKRVVLAKVDTFSSFGTPEELKISTENHDQ